MWGKPFLPSTKECSMELKVHDRVKGEYSSDTYTGIVYAIDCTKNPIRATIKRDDGKSGSGENTGGGRPGWVVFRNSDGSWGANENYGTLTIISQLNISQGGSMTNLKEQFALSLVNEPQKSFRSAGVTDGNDMLTQEGANVFLSWLLHTKHTGEFKKVVDDIIGKKEDPK
jgi:hypothetical protein